MNLRIQILSVWFPLLAHSATLDRGEWFLNADPGFGAGTSIQMNATSTASASVTVSPADLAALTPGVHLVGVRFRDTLGEWGGTAWRPFYKAALENPATLQSGEWFVDSDPGFGLGIGFPVTPQILGVSIPSTTISSLAPGIHLIGIRFLDGNGSWGHTAWRPFYREEQISAAPQIVSLEYQIAIDGNIVASNSQNTTSPASLVNFQVIHGKNSLQLGSPHILQIVPVDAAGRKGIPLCVDFTYLTYGDAWTETHFDESERQDLEIAGPDADPDEDGLSNATEKLFALNPRDGSDAAKAAARITTIGTGITFSFRVPDGGSVGNDGIYRTSNLNYNLMTGSIPSATSATPASWFTGWTLQTQEHGAAILNISLQPPPAEKNFFRLQGSNQ